MSNYFKIYEDMDYSAVAKQTLLFGVNDGVVTLMDIDENVIDTMTITSRFGKKGGLNMTGCQRALFKKFMANR